MRFPIVSCSISCKSLRFLRNNKIMTTLRQFCYYYISLCNFIKMFFLFFGRSGHISRFWIYNPSWTYVYIQFRIGFFTTKQPLIPRLAQKNKMAGLSSYLASVCKSILCVFLYTVKNRKQKLDVGKQRWAFGSWSVRARGSQVGTSWTDVGRCLNFNMSGRCASCRGTGGDSANSLFYKKEE